MIIRDLRWFSGKHVAGNEDIFLKNLSTCALQLNKNIAVKILKSKGKRAKKRMHTVDKIFCETVLYLWDTNMFGVGVRRIVPHKRYRERMDTTQFEPISTIDGILISPTGQVLNPEILFIYSTALGLAGD